jgi:hypothetical protein
MKYNYFLALAGVAVAASTGFSQTSIPIADNSFETPAPATYIGFGNNNPAYVTGWTTTNASGGDDYSIKTIGDANGQVPVTGADGSQTLEDFNFPGGGANGGGSVYQVEDGTLSTTATSYAAGTYTLTAFAGSAYSGGTVGPEIGDTFYFALSSAPTVPIASTVIVAGANDTLSSFSVQLDNTAGIASGPIVVGFQSPGGAAQTNMEIDNFSLTFAAVPEPGSMAIAAFGGFGLLCLARRRLA